MSRKRRHFYYDLDGIKWMENEPGSGFYWLASQYLNYHKQGVLAKMFNGCPQTIMGPKPGTRAAAAPSAPTQAPPPASGETPPEPPRSG